MDKQHVLDEIRRTAEENGGVPLGKKRFERETGIRESDWYGVHWARWSDAVQEAGFSPNKLREAYEEKFILEKLISLIRELGHFPADGELRLRANMDSSFPSHNVFTAQLGKKKNKVEKVLRYCEAHPGFEDIPPLLPVIVPAAPETDVDESPEEFGFVYLLKSGRYYKIGRTNAVGRREREIALQLPEKAATVHSIKTDDPAGIEAYWHKRFESKRKQGEWFELSPQDVKAFKRRKFM